MPQLTTSLMLILALTLVSASCQSEEMPKPESKKPSGSYDEMIQEVKWSLAAPELKASLQEYIKQTYPGWETKGEMLQFSKHGFYVVVVDIAAGKQRQSVTVVSRIFRKTDGSYYWKCEPFTPEIKSIQELIETADKAELGR